MLIAVSLWGCSDDEPSEKTSKVETRSGNPSKSKLRNLPGPQASTSKIQKKLPQEIVDPEDEEDRNDEAAAEAIKQTRKIKEGCLKVLGTVHVGVGKGKKFKSAVAARDFAINEVSRAIVRIKNVSHVRSRSKKEGILASKELREKLIQVLAWIDEEAATPLNVS